MWGALKNAAAVATAAAEKAQKSATELLEKLDGQLEDVEYEDDEVENGEENEESDDRALSSDVNTNNIAIAGVVSGFASYAFSASRDFITSLDKIDDDEDPRQV